MESEAGDKVGDLHSTMPVELPIVDRGLFLSVERKRIFEKKGFN